VSVFLQTGRKKGLAVLVVMFTAYAMKHVIISLLAAIPMIGAAYAQNTAAPFVLGPTDTVVPPPLDLGPSEALKIVSETGTHEFMVEIADSPAEQTRGLMFRNELPPNGGMLFEFSKPKVSSIWMKNTGIQLDILFVRGNGTILKIEHLASITSEGVVAAVLELPGGRAKALGIIPGDMVQHEFFAATEK